MVSVAVNAPRTPVTVGSGGLATATLPNICKMPPPPAPFAPTPLPNIGMSGKMPFGYSTTVSIENFPVAIAGASFGSVGDIASLPTGGGVVSNNAEGPTTFVAPGSLDVQIEGRNVQLLGDQMLNNNGPPGTPANSATLGGVLQSPQAAALGVLPEAQEICDTHCKCLEEGRTDHQRCIDEKVFAADQRQNYTKRLKTEVSFKMDGPEGPTAVMSKREPWRQSRARAIKGCPRPDAIVVDKPNKPWSGDNIKAVIECKWGKDPADPEQLQEYQKIAGGNPLKIVPIDDKNCKCKDDDDDEPHFDPVPVPEEEGAKEKKKKEEKKPEQQPEPVRPGVPAPDPALVGILALALGILMMLMMGPKPAPALAPLGSGEGDNGA